MTEHVKLWKSLRMKIIGAVFIMVLLTGVMFMVIFIPNIKDTLNQNTKRYMEDTAHAYGSAIEENIVKFGADRALDSNTLDQKLEGVKINDLKSSYIYVVDPTGTMLYHPTPEKIGQPVENEAVKKTVAKIQKKEKVVNEVIEYKFKGVMKSAAIYVDEAQTFILVVTADKDEVMKPLTKVVKRGVIGLAIIIVIATIICVQIAVIIVRPINRIAGVTNELSEMNFAEYPAMSKLLTREDEIGLMAHALEHLRQELVKAFSAIKIKSDSVMNAATALTNDASETSTTMSQVENAVNDIADGAASQADETQRATESILLMGTMVEQTNQEVERLLDFANDMKASTEQAKLVLRELDNINRTAEEYIDVISAQTDTTNESAIQISEATKLITAIAEETNLLSLNASIEAARAGEQGRGFAVVAAEIQKLAEQSNESAHQIETILQQLLEDSEQAVETMHQVKSVMLEQSVHVEETDRAFNQIASGVEESITGINSIANRTKELDDARVSVVDVVQNLTAIAEENAAGTEQTSASTSAVSAIVEDISGKSESLTQIAQELDEGISQFRF